MCWFNMSSSIFHLIYSFIAAITTFFQIEVNYLDQIMTKFSLDLNLIKLKNNYHNTTQFTIFSQTIIKLSLILLFQC